MMNKIKMNFDLIMLFLTFIIIIATITCVATININFVGIKTYSVSGIKEIVASIRDTTTKYNETKLQYNTKLTEKETIEDKFRSEKQKYESISDETISLIQEVTKEQKYMIEYLWVVLGDYAADNELQLIVMEPGSNATFKVSSEGIAIENKTTQTEKTTTAKTTTSKTDSDVENTTVSLLQSTDDSTIKTLVLGKYQNIADFVFEVENDKSLKFKLDNITMQYAGSNSVVATFDVLDMSVLMK